jgi:rubrerythrin
VKIFKTANYKKMNKKAHWTEEDEEMSQYNYDKAKAKKDGVPFVSREESEWEVGKAEAEMEARKEREQMEKTKQWYACEDCGYRYEDNLLEPINCPSCKSGKWQYIEDWYRGLDSSRPYGELNT